MQPALSHLLLPTGTFLLVLVFLLLQRPASSDQWSLTTICHYHHHQPHLDCLNLLPVTSSSFPLRSTMPKKSNTTRRPLRSSVAAVASVPEPSEIISELSASYDGDEAPSEMSFTSGHIPGEVVIITTSGKQYHSISSTEKIGNHQTTTTTNKVVSANPTLNLLLSQPIVTIAPGTATSTATTTAAKRSRNVPSTSSSKRHCTSSTAPPSSQPSSVAASTSTVEPAKVAAAVVQEKPPPSYLPEIRKMMHSFGDAKTPRPEAAKLVEKIVQSQMELVIVEAQAIASTRGASCIGLEEFLFLLRNDVNKLSRLVRFLQFKDLRPKLSSASSLASNKENSTSSTSKDDDSKSNSQDLEEFYIDFDASKPETFLPGNCQTKRVRLCYNFLSQIDTSLGRLGAIFTENFHPDPLTRERNRRLSDFTERMSVRDYLYYQSCRSVSFGGSPGSVCLSSKFLEWLLPKGRRVELGIGKINGLALEALQHLAHETVAVLVELSLIIKSEADRDLEAEEAPTYLKAHEYSRSDEEDYKSREYRENKARYKDSILSQYFGENKDKKTQGRSPNGGRSVIKESICSHTKKFASDVMAKAVTRFAYHIGAVDLIRKKAAAASTTTTTSGMNPWAQAISPANILEAMRRFEARPTVFGRFARCHAVKSPRQRILCI